MIKSLKIKDPFDSKTKRKIWVYLPSDYPLNNKKYPVLYMFDGHNLFYDKLATYGTCWGLKEYLDKEKLDIIVVGIDCNHVGNNRLNEYSPFTFKTRQFGQIIGDGSITSKWIINELKPFIDERFQTNKTREYTFIAGSSMGGLMSFYTICNYSKYFSKALCMSSSFEFNPKECLDLVKSSKINPNTSVLLHIGTDEIKSKKNFQKYLITMMNITNIFNEKNIKCYNYLKDLGQHNESSWNKELPRMFDFIFNK